MPELTDPADPATRAVDRDSLAAVGRALASLDETETAALLQKLLRIKDNIQIGRAHV